MGFGTIIKLEMEGEIGIVTYDIPGVPEYLVTGGPCRVLQPDGYAGKG